MTTSTQLQYAPEEVERAQRALVLGRAEFDSPDFTEEDKLIVEAEKYANSCPIVTGEWLEVCFVQKVGMQTGLCSDFEKWHNANCFQKKLARRKAETF